MRYRKMYKGMPYWSQAASLQREIDYQEALKRAAEEKLKEKNERREDENPR